MCVGGLALRLFGLTFGLPDIHNPDEVAIMNRALAFATGDLNPKNFVYPSFYFYLLFVWEGLFFMAGWVVGLYRSVADFERAFFTDPSLLFAAGRTLTAIMGTMTVWAVYKLGATLHREAVGLVAAAFLAVAPIAVRDAHYVKHDVPVTLLIVLTHVILARLLVDAGYRLRLWGWIVAGGLCGLATSTHYYAFFVAVPLIATAFIDLRPAMTLERRLSRLAAAAVAAGAVFFAASPFMLIEPAAVIRDVVANREIVLDRAVAASGVFSSLPRYVELLATDALGMPIFLAAVAGVGLAIIADWRRAVLLIAFSVPFLLFISNTYPATRYLNPLLPFLTLAAALPVVRVARVSSYAGAVSVVLTAALALPALVASIQTGRFFRQADTRTQARHFIERNLPDGGSVLVQPYSAALRQSREGLIEALRLHLGSETRASTKFQRQLSLHPYPSPSYRTIYLGDGGLDKDKIYVPPSALTGSAPLESLRALALEYVVLKRYNADSSLNPLIAALNQEGRLLATFTPFAAGSGDTAADAVEPFLHNTDARIDPRLARPGPMIEVWKIDR